MVNIIDKTVVLTGPCGLLTQALAARLTELGADVAWVTDDVKTATRVCQNISDLREVSEKFGRATAFEMEVRDLDSASNTFSRAAETFGGVDVYLDTHLYGLNIPFYKNDNLADFRPQLEQALLRIKLLTDAAQSFLKSRTKAKILYVFNSLDALSAEKVKSSAFVEFESFVHKLGIDNNTQNTCVNALAVGASEEFLISRFGKGKTVQTALKELIQVIPHARLIDYSEVANTIAFLVSPQSTGISGQTIKIDHAL